MDREVQATEATYEIVAIVVRGHEARSAHLQISVSWFLCGESPPEASPRDHAATREGNARVVHRRRPLAANIFGFDYVAARNCTRSFATSSGRVQCIMWPASGISARVRFWKEARRSSSSGGWKPFGPPWTKRTGHVIFFANAIQSFALKGTGEVVR